MKIGELDIKKAYFGAKELTPNDIFLGDVAIIEKSGPPNDEIWYTSNDGDIVSPTEASEFPARVSNTYSDGKGVLKFVSDISKIGSSAFASTKRLTSVTIPKSVTSIGAAAFRNCSRLTAISYAGTKSQWSAVTKGNIWHENVPATVVHCTDGDVAL